MADDQRRSELKIAETYYITQSSNDDGNGNRYSNNNEIIKTIQSGF